MPLSDEERTTSRTNGTSPGEHDDMQEISTPRRSSIPTGDARALRILAKSVYRELKASGHSRSDIVGFTNALLELVTSDIKTDADA